MEKLPANLESLQRPALVELSLRINSDWSVHQWWTRPKLVRRLRSWERERKLGEGAGDADAELEKGHVAVVADGEAKLEKGHSADVAKITLPSNLDSLQRPALVELSERVNPDWPTNCYWTKPKLVRRLRSWESEWMLSLSGEDLLAMALKANPKRSNPKRSYKSSKEVYISELTAAMTRVFTDVCCSLQYGVVHCVSSLHEKPRKRNGISRSDVAGGVQHQRVCFASKDRKI